MTVYLFKKQNEGGYIRHKKDSGFNGYVMVGDWSWALDEARRQSAIHGVECYPVECEITEVR